MMSFGSNHIGPLAGEAPRGSGIVVNNAVNNAVINNKNQLNDFIGLANEVSGIAAADDIDQTGLH